MTEPATEQQTGANAVEAVVSLLGEKPKPETIVKTVKADESPDESQIVKDDPELNFADPDESPKDDKPDEDADKGETVDTVGDDDQPVTLKELSENLEVDVKELYDVAIPLGGGESISLGELKDGHKKAADLLSNQAEWETNKTHKENELMIARREVEQLVTLGNQHGLITPKLLERLEDIHVANMTREHKSLIRAIPSWADPVIRKAEFEQVVSIMSEWGFSENEVLNRPDHREVKFMYDMTQRILKVRGAISKRDSANKKDVPSDTGRGKVRNLPKKSALKTRIAEANKRGNKAEQIDLAAELINSTI